MNPSRRFLYEVLNSGLALEMITPDDVLQHVTPEVLAHHLPISLKARLLQASLNAERMTPKLVVEVVGVEALVEHAPMPVLWACVRACAARQLQGQAEDAIGASLGIAPGAAVGSGAMATVVNGTVLAGAPAADDLQLKPSKPARPMSLRPTSAPPRISALSPRSQVVRRPDPSASGGMFEPVRGEESPDFEIVEETEAPTRQRTAPPGRPVGDDDTRPGPKS